MVNTHNDHKLKSTELFMIKRDVEEIAFLIKEKSYMLPSSVPDIEYISEQIDKITGKPAGAVINQKFRQIPLPGEVGCLYL